MKQFSFPDGFIDDVCTQKSSGKDTKMYLAEFKKAKGQNKVII